MLFDELLDQIKLGQKSNYSEKELREELMRRSSTKETPSTSHVLEPPKSSLRVAKFRDFMDKLEADGSNYRTWAHRFRLVAMDYWNNESDTPLDIPVLKGALLLYLPNNILPAYETLPTASEIWKRLSNTYNGVNNGRALTLMTELFSLKLSENPETDNGKILTLLSNFEDALGTNTINLKQIGALAVGALINRHQILTAIRPLVNHAEEPQKLDSLLRMMLKERAVKATGNTPKQDKGSLAHGKSTTCSNMIILRGQNRPCGYTLQGVDKKCPRCNPCQLCQSKNLQKTWHIEGSFQCQEQNKANGNNYSTFHAHHRKNKDIKKIVLCLDSGATITMLNDKKAFTNMQEKLSYILTASGESIASPAQGQIALSEHFKVLAKYVPSLTTNLLAVRQLTNLGCKVIFEKETAQVLLKNTEILRAHIEDDLWQISLNANHPLTVIPQTTNQALAVQTRNQSKINQNNQSTTSTHPKQTKEKPSPAKPSTTIKNSLNITTANNPSRNKIVNGPVTWKDLHAKFNHLNVSDLKHIIKLDPNIKMIGSENDVKDCEICIQGKMAIGTFNTGNAHRATRPGDTILVDICDMTVTSLWNYKYYLHIQDDYSRYSEVFLLTSRDKADNVTKYIQQFIKRAETKFNYRITTIRADNEFRYSALDDYCKLHGIQQEFTTRDTSQQNGVAEKGLRTINNGARCALLQSGLSCRDYWCEAVMYACFTKNYRPTIANNLKTPFELWHGRKPEICNLRIFGETVYLKDDSKDRKKPDPKAIKGMFIGYSPDQKAYRVLITPGTDKVINAPAQKTRFLTQFTKPFNLNNSMFLENDIETSNSKQ